MIALEGDAQTWLEKMKGPAYVSKGTVLFKRHMVPSVGNTEMGPAGNWNSDHSVFSTRLRSLYCEKKCPLYKAAIWKYTL